MNTLYKCLYNVYLHSNIHTPKPLMNIKTIFYLPHVEPWNCLSIVEYSSCQDFQSTLSYGIFAYDAAFKNTGTYRRKMEDHPVGQNK